MLNCFLKCLVLLTPLLTTPCHGFWWRSTTTEAPPEPVMQQIPLTYFRTYTYQPMAGNPLPFPLMGSTDYISNYAALANNPYFNSIMSIMPPTAAVAPVATKRNDVKLLGNAKRPSKSYASVNNVRSWQSGYLTTPKARTSTTARATTTTTPEPTTTSTTTTTTTTTTPVPTTTTSTTATFEENSLDFNGSDAPSGSPSVPVIKADSLVNIESAYPAFNRKVYTNHFNINYNRPVYPFPEYSIYKPLASSGNLNSNDDALMAPATSPTISTPSNIEFVPCMCPVNIQGAYPSGMPIAGNPSNSIFLAQGRTNSEIESETELIKAEEIEEMGSVEAEQANGPLAKNNKEGMQVFNMDEDDSEEVVTPSNGLTP